MCCKRFVQSADRSPQVELGAGPAASPIDIFRPPPSAARHQGARPGEPGLRHSSLAEKQEPAMRATGQPNESGPLTARQAQNDMAGRRPDVCGEENLDDQDEYGASSPAIATALRDRRVGSRVGGVAGGLDGRARGQPGRPVLRPGLGLERRVEPMRVRASRRKRAGRAGRTWWAGWARRPWWPRWTGSAGAALDMSYDRTATSGAQQCRHPDLDFPSTGLRPADAAAVGVPSAARRGDRAAA